VIAVEASAPAMTRGSMLLCLVKYLEQEIRISFRFIEW